MAAKVPGKLQESNILFAHVVQNANDAEIFASKTNNAAPRPSELTLQRLYPHDRRVEMLLEEFLENVHKGRSGNMGPLRHHKDTIEFCASNVLDVRNPITQRWLKCETLELL